MNAISIAAVREFMAVQDRIRPALNCFSQEQHATDTRGRRGCWCWSFQASPFLSNRSPRRRRIESKSPRRIEYFDVQMAKVWRLYEKKGKLSHPKNHLKEKKKNLAKNSPNHRFQLSEQIVGPRPVSSLPPLSYLSNRVSPTQTAMSLRIYNLVAMHSLWTALPTSFYQETRGKGSNIGEAISTYRHRRWRSEHQVAEPVSLFPREFSRPERSLWFLIPVFAVALKTNIKGKMLWLAIM